MLQTSIDYGLTIAEELLLWDEYGLLVGTSMQLSTLDDATDVGKRLERGRLAAQKIPDENKRAELVGQLERTAYAYRTAKAEADGATDSLTREVEIYKEMARALGVDLNDPNDDIAHIVLLGIRDLNPERVLKDCEHLFVTLGSRGLVAEWLKLPTAGSKRVHCLLHGYAVESLSLDDVYASFKAAHCDKCNDIKPRPANWKWTREWQQGQDELHGKKLRERFREGK